MLGLTTKDADTTSSVWPSAAALATASVPVMPFAPGRFSTKNDCPVWTASCCAISRAITSGAPPGPNGTIRRTGRLG